MSDTVEEQAPGSDQELGDGRGAGGGRGVRQLKGKVGSHRMPSSISFRVKGSIWSCDSRGRK